MHGTYIKRNWIELNWIIIIIIIIIKKTLLLWENFFLITDMSRKFRSSSSQSFELSPHLHFNMDT